MKHEIASRRFVRLLFIALVPLLFFQLKLRTDTEPYPAILLPGGETLLKAEGSFTGVETVCIAEDATGKKYPFSPASVLDVVPTNYRPFVLESGFGITTDRVVRRLPIPFSDRRLQLGRRRTPSQLAETRAWLRTKLQRTLAIDAVRIRILEYAVTTYYSEAPVRQERRLQSENIVELIGGGE